MYFLTFSQSSAPVLKIILLLLLTILLAGCGTSHQATDSSKVKYDSAYKNLKNDTAQYHKVAIADSGFIFSLPLFRPAIKPGESISQYAADNANSIRVYGKKETISDSQDIIHEKAQGEISKVVQTESKKVDSDHSLKANLSTSWVWILGGIVTLLIIVLLFLRNLKII